MEPSKTPVALLILLFLCTLVPAVGVFGMHSYIPHLLLKLHYAEEDIGYYHGIISAEHFISCSLILLLTGKHYQNISTRRLLVALSFLQAAAFLCMSFTSSMTWLAVSVFLTATHILMIPVVDCIVYRISSSDNQAMFYNYAVTTPFNMALFLGPALGGFLSFPTEQYRSIVSNEFLKKYEIFLPNLILALFMLFVAFLAMNLIPKDMETRRVNDRTISEPSESHSLLKEKENINSASMYIQLLKLNDLRIAIFAQIIYSITSQGFLTAFALWSQTHSHLHSLDYTPSQYGLLMLLAGILVLPFDVLFVGRSINSLGIKTGLIVYTLLQMFCISIIVCFHFKIFYLTFGSCTLANSLARLSSSGCKIAISTLFYNAVPSHFMGEFMAMRTLLGHGFNASWTFNSRQLFCMVFDKCC